MAEEKKLDEGDCGLKGCTNPVYSDETSKAWLGFRDYTGKRRVVFVCQYHYDLVRDYSPSYSVQVNPIDQEVTLRADPTLN